MNEITKQEKLIDLQSAPLRYKMILTRERIREAVEKYTLNPIKELLDLLRFISVREDINENDKLKTFVICILLIKQYIDACYLSFSGGIDSTVLAHIIRKMYPEMKLVFFDTGLEDPSIRSFVKTVLNVEWLKPSKPYKEVLEQHGAPVISKSISMAISRLRGAIKAIEKRQGKERDELYSLQERIDDYVYIGKKKQQIELRLHGGVNPTSGREQTTGVIPEKWHDLALNGTYKISDECCNALKKNPAADYYKEHGGCAILGTMASDSMNRRLDWYKNGCNAFGKKKPQSRPLSLWTEADVWQYVRENNLEYASIYDQDEDTVGSGCDLCLMGIEKDPNRFVRLKHHRPHRYKYCMEVLGYKEILESLGVPTGLEDKIYKEPEQAELPLEDKKETLRSETQNSFILIQGGDFSGRAEEETPKTEVSETEASNEVIAACRGSGMYSAPLSGFQARSEGLRG